MKTMVHEFSTIVYVKSTIVLPSMVLFYSKRWIFAYLPWFYNSFLYTFKKNVPCYIFLDIYHGSIIVGCFVP